MKKAAVVLIAILLVVLGIEFSLSVVYHDEQKAIVIANYYLLNLIRKDYRAAYNDQLSKAFKQMYPFSEYKTYLEQNNKVLGEIDKASFDHFLPIQGQRKIQLFYNVKHKKARDVLYDFILEGDGLKGYKIYRVDVRDQERHLINRGITKKDKNIFSEITVDGIKR